MASLSVPLSPKRVNSLSLSLWIRFQPTSKAQNHVASCRFPPPPLPLPKAQLPAPRSPNSPHPGRQDGLAAGRRQAPHPADPALHETLLRRLHLRGARRPGGVETDRERVFAGGGPTSPPPPKKPTRGPAFTNSKTCKQPGDGGFNQGLLRFPGSQGARLQGPSSQGPRRTHIWRH